MLVHELKRREAMFERWHKERQSILLLLSTFDTSEASSRIGELCALPVDRVSPTLLLTLYQISY